MMTWTRTLRRVVGLGTPKAADADVQRAAATARRQAVERPPIDIAPNDPLLAYFAESRGAVSLDELQLDSPAVQALRARGSKLVVPLISQGELIGLLDLGPRLSDQEYSREDRRLLDKLAGQAAPAVRVAQLVREQESEVRARARRPRDWRRHRTRRPRRAGHGHDPEHPQKRRAAPGVAGCRAGAGKRPAA